MRFMILFAALISVGCFSSGNQQIADENLVAQIIKGKSTKVDVTSLFGKPSVVDFQDEKEKWVYVHSYGSVRGTTFIPFAGAFIGGADTRMETLTVIFDKAGVVQDLGQGQMTGGGGGLQDAEVKPPAEKPPEKKPAPAEEPPKRPIYG